GAVGCAPPGPPPRPRLRRRPRARRRHEDRRVVGRARAARTASRPRVRPARLHYRGRHRRTHRAGVDPGALDRAPPSPRTRLPDPDPAGTTGPLKQGPGRFRRNTRRRQNTSTAKTVERIRPAITGRKHLRARSSTGTRAKPATATSEDHAMMTPPPAQMLPI